MEKTKQLNDAANMSTCRQQPATQRHVKHDADYEITSGNVKSAATPLTIPRTSGKPQNTIALKGHHQC
jgi:hypothetical protein